MPRNRHDETRRIRKDAEPQFEKPMKHSDNSGVASAKPRVITGSDDATINKWPPDVDHPPKDWDLNFDISGQEESPDREKGKDKA